MLDTDLPAIVISALAGVVVCVELVLLLPAAEQGRKMLKLSGKARRVMRSPTISDHWKEKAVLAYSRQLLASSLAGAVCLVLACLGFLTGYCLFGLLFLGDLSAVIKTLSRWEMQLITLGAGLLYVCVRRGVHRQKQQPHSDYTAAAQILHHVVLNHSLVKSMAFEIDCLLAGRQAVQAGCGSPVYIAGLARSGTTILLKALYATGAFAALTYRDMPLVTAPYVWSTITKGKTLSRGASRERAHGDRLAVHYDSPEAFEEVFWMTFSKARYVKGDHLELQDADADLIDDYRKYVRNIIAKSGHSGSVRYLAKNNNHLLRINAIRSAFPGAVVVVPFRHPLHHARSLQHQHERFLKRHAEDPFSLKYMNWLGHFEFGANVKPFKVSEDALPAGYQELSRLSYWLRYWGRVYAYLLEHHASDVLFVQYDALCTHPRQVLACLETRLSLPGGSLQAFSSAIQPPEKRVPESETEALPAQVQDVYQLLQETGLSFRTIGQANIQEKEK